MISIFIFALISFAIEVHAAEEVISCANAGLVFTKSTLTCDATDPDKGQWFFQYPNPFVKNDCEQANLPAPIYSKVCTDNYIYGCNPGYEFDLVEFGCKNCTAGSYGRGNVLSFNNYVTAPPEFNVEMVNALDFVDPGSALNCNKEDDSPFSGSGLFGFADHYELSSGPWCHVSATFEIDFLHESAKGGDLIFEFKTQDYYTFSGLAVLDDTCSSLPIEVENLGFSQQFKQTTVSLPDNARYVKFYVESYEYRSSLSLRNIRLTNAQNNRRCKPCEPGYFADQEGSAECTPCPAGQYSEEWAATSCQPCASGESSTPGQKKCHKKPTCNENFYTVRATPCDELNKRTLTLQLDADERTACILPEGGHTEILQQQTCKPCPPGSLQSTATQCVPCPVDQTSVDGGSCHVCAAGFGKTHGYMFDQWYREFDSSVLTFTCNIPDLCSPAYYYGDHLRMGYKSGSVFAFDHVAVIHLPAGIEGFSDQSKNLLPREDSHFLIDFETNCVSDCGVEIFFVVASQSRPMQKFNGKIARTTIQVPFTDVRTTEIHVRFSKYTNSYMFNWQPEYSGDQLLIYNMTVVHSKNTPVIKCEKCSTDVDENGACYPCLPGKFPRTTNFWTNCESCPPREIVVGRFTEPKTPEEACKPCPFGMTDYNGLYCYVPEKVSFTALDRTYNVSLLADPFKIETPVKFSDSGKKEVRQFSFNLEIGPGVKPLECGPNMKTQVCMYRTLNGLPDNNAFIDVGQELFQVAPSDLDPDILSEMNSYYNQSGFDHDATGHDLHFFFKTYDDTKKCKLVDGSSKLTIVSMRCDPKTDPHAQLGKMRLPNNCPLGSCDDCFYHFLMYSKVGCPICTDKDYIAHTSECTAEGISPIYFSKTGFCLDPPGHASVISTGCSFLSKTTKVVLSVIFPILLILSLVIWGCHRHNKKLTYRYQRLVEQNDNPGSRPVDGTECSIPADQADEDEEGDMDITAANNKIAGSIVFRKSDHEEL